MAIRCCALILSAVVLLAPIVTQIAGAAPQRVDSEQANALAIEAGHNTFRQFCAPCHGVDGKGRGLVSPILTTPPADLTTAKGRNMGVFPLAAFEAMLTATTLPSHSSGQMPLWGATFRAIDTSPTLARARVANLLAYLESIQK